MELYTDVCEIFIESVYLSEYCRRSYFFRFILVASYYPDFRIPLLVEDTIFEELSFIKVEDYSDLLKLLLKLLPNSSHLFELSVKSNIISRSITLAIPLSKILVGFPHIKLLRFIRMFIEICNPEIKKQAFGVLF